MATLIDAPLRVLFLSSYTGLGGGETSLLGLLAAFDRARIVPCLACPRDGQLADAARRLGIEVRLVAWRGVPVWNVPAIWARAPAASRILACVDDFKPAIVHSEFHALPYAVGAARRRRLPVVFTSFGWWFRPWPWQQELYRDPRITVLAISEAVRRGFLGEPPFMDPGRVHVVHLGVDAHRYRPRPSHRNAIRQRFSLSVDAPLVTLVARFQDVKGHHIFLAMARRVLASAPAARFAIAGENVFGGTGDERYKRRVLRAAADDPILRDAVRFLGWVPDPEALIAASDVVVCSSLFESFGMVPIEAMACEVPVVSSDVGGPSETIVDGETGFLVPPNRPDLLADRVLQLLADPGRRRVFGAAGRARVVASFSVERYAETMTAMFRAVADSAPLCASSAS